MPITSLTLPGLRAGIVAVLEAVDGLKVYDHEPATLDALPCATVEFDTFDRNGVRLPSVGDGGGREESMMGGVDLLTNWVVRLYVDVGTRDRVEVQTDLLVLVGAVLGEFNLVDGNFTNEVLPGQTSGGQVISSSLESGGPPIIFETDGTDRMTLAIECRCGVSSFH